VEHDLPATIVTLIERGEPIWTYGRGETMLGNGTPPTADSVFRIASMTKSFTAAAILLLRDRGALELDDPIVRHLPWAATIGAPSDARPISIRDLLTMNAGFPTDDPWGDRQESAPIASFDALVAGGLTFARPPGTGFEYSNLGYALLGRVVTQASGVDYLDFVTRDVLEPLGMHATRFDTSAIDDAVRAHGYARPEGRLVPEPVTSPGAFSPMGGLHSSARDLAVWVRGFTAPAGARHPLAFASRREMQQGRTFVRSDSRTVDATQQAIVIWTYGYGLSIDVDSTAGTFVNHSGGYPGFGSHMRWHPGSGFGIVALANKTYAPMRVLAAELLYDVVASYARPVDIAAGLLPQTRDAMDVAERLLARWDDALASAHVAENLDLDAPRRFRRETFERVASEIGAFGHARQTLSSRSPAHATWRVVGERGEAELEIMLTPENPPRLQTLEVRGPL
jgi:CubicO group peptidase (beta-lactamase class C family)